MERDSLDEGSILPNVCVHMQLIECLTGEVDYPRLTWPYVCFYLTSRIGYFHASLEAEAGNPWSRCGTYDGQIGTAF